MTRITAETLETRVMLAGNVVVNELMYHASSQNVGDEWIELYNKGGNTVDLTGWHFGKGITYAMPAGTTLGANQYLVVAHDVSRFHVNYPSVTNVVGGWTGQLSNNGDTVEIDDATGSSENSVSYGTDGEWAVREKDRGVQLVNLITRAGSTATVNVPANGYSNGDSVQLSGAAQPEYNGTFTVSAANASGFAITVGGSPASPATPATVGGTILSRQLTDLGHAGVAWFSAADGLGKSLELINAALTNDAAQNWTASSTYQGTPGAANSVVSANVAPLVLSPKQSPIVPRSTDAVTVTASLVDEAGTAQSASLNYRLDGGTSFTSVAMHDDGLNGDAAANDGTWSAIIPAQANNAVVEYYITATDGSFARSWPAVTTDGTHSANALYQVDDSAAYTGSQPVFKLIMTSADKAELATIGSPSSASQLSNAEFNGTFVSIDGTGTEQRYIVGFRNRGGGSRDVLPNNRRVNFNNGDRWHGYRAINLDGQYSLEEVIGSAIFRTAGVPAQNSSPVQVRVNNVNEATAGTTNDMFGSYSWLDAENSDFVGEHFPTDSGGNYYRGVDGSHNANLTYLGTDPSLYYYKYPKQNNSEPNDYTDLFNLTKAFDTTQTPDSVATDTNNFVDVLGQRLNIAEAARYFAVNSLIGNEETALGTGYGDDYSLYSGLIDPRFQIVAHDLDTILGRGDTAGNIDKSMLSAAALTTIKRFLTNPAFAPVYFKTLRDLATGALSPAAVLPVVDQTLADYVSVDVINGFKAFITGRNNFVLASIPTTLTATSALTVTNGYPSLTGTASTATTILTGVADVTQTRSVLVNGVAATYTAIPNATPTTGPYGAWSAATVTLNPGINRVLVQELDGAGKEVGRTSIDVYYNRTSGGTTVAAGNVSGNWTPGNSPYTVTGSLTVATGTTLTIQPGTTVFFNTGTGILVNGTLTAVGTDTQHIRMTRLPGASTTWKGLDFENNQNDSRLGYVDQEYGDAGFYSPAHGSTPSVMVNNSRISIDHMTWAGTTKELVNCISSSIKMTNSVTPNTVGVECLHFWIMPANGYAIYQGNTFGTTTQHNDIIDLTSGSLTSPVAQFLDNVFLGNGPAGNADDLLDLDSTNAYVEGNVFTNVTATATADTNSAVSGGTDPSFPGVPSTITCVRNYFYNVEHGYLFKEGNFLTSVNNTFDGVLKSVYNFDEPGNGTAGPGKGAYVDGDVVYNLASGGALFTNYTAATQLSINHSVIPIAPTSGVTSVGNVITTDPRLVNPNALSSTSTAADVRAALQLRSGSPAVGFGPNGRDAGAAVPAGASISGEPTSPTASTTATLKVGGPDIYSYRYRINGGAWSAEVATTGTQSLNPVVPPITLTGLTPGTYTVQVESRNYAGVLQADTAATTSRTWTVVASPSVLINEVLAANSAAVNHEGTTPDLVELFNNGPAAVDLADMSLTDDPTSPRKFVFPAGTTIPANGYLVLYADNANPTSGIHLGFSFKQNGEGVYLYKTAAAGGGLADSVVFGSQIEDLSIGRLTGGAWGLTKPTFGSANIAQPTGDSSLLKINEWLTSGVAPLANDFVELYNPDTLPVSLGGLSLTDQIATTPALSPIPALSFMPAAGFASFVADGHPESGADHVNFKLSSDRGEVGLFDAAGNRIDSVQYLAQKTAVSQGRSPNGDNSAKPFTYFAQPSPGVSNPAVSTTTQSLGTYTDTWKYYQSGALTTGWQATSFNDSSWSSGGGLLYVSNFTLPAPKTTALTIGQVTYYFRRHFTFTGNPANATLILNTILDDGAVVYLNGVEVLRVGMPAGTITGTTVANRLISPQNATFDGPFNVPTTSLINGDNVIAVEVHQQAAGSSDVVFGLAAAAISTVTTAAPAPLRVTEISYNPAYDAPASSIYTSDDAEFIELKNIGSSPLNLTNYQFTAGIIFTFPSTTLAPGANIVVVKNSAAFIQRYGTGVNIAGQYTDTLSNAGEEIRLIDSSGNVVQDFTYSDAWQPTTDGDGYTLVINNPNADPSTWGTSTSWHASTSILGTPGMDELAVVPAAGSVVINELLSHAATAGNDWIEIRNTTAAAIDLTGWYLSDSSSNLLKYALPGGSIVPANGYLVLTESASFGTAFGFSHDGDQAYLSSSLSVGTLSGYRSGVNFGTAETGVPFTAYQTSTGRVDFVAENRPTPGSVNALPKESPVVINELMYHPSGSGDEWIELRNTTVNTAPLYDPANPANTWQFTNGVVFSFPTGASIPAAGYALVVPIDPATFRTKYSIPVGVPIYGPYTGALNNSGEDVEISKPNAPEANVPLSYVRVDDVNYGSASPWPTSPNGNGPTLARINSFTYGNDVINWQAGPTGGTPGVTNGTDVTSPLSLSGPTIYLRIDPDGSTLDIYTNATGVGTPAATVPALTVSILQLSAVSSVTIDNTYGVVAPAGGIQLSGTAATLNLVGSPGSDSVIINGPAVTFDGVSISSTGVATVNVTGNAGADTVTQLAQPPFTPVFIDPTDVDALNVSAGTYSFATPTAGSGLSVVSLAALMVGSSATVTIPTAPAVTDRVALVLGSLTVNGHLDLGNSDLILRGVTASAASALLTSGAVYSSAVTGDSTHLTTLAPSPGPRTFDTVAVSAGDSVIRHTYFGDANFDGKIDGSDYSLIDSGYLYGGVGWENGDFNSDGVVDGSDYSLIDNAFNRQGAGVGPSSMIAGPAAKVATIAAVAESTKQVRPASRFSTLVIADDYWQHRKHPAVKTADMTETSKNKGF